MVVARSPAVIEIEKMTPSVEMFPGFVELIEEAKNQIDVDEWKILTKKS